MPKKALILVFLIALTAVSTSVNAHAEDLSLMRRWVVFPFDSDPSLKASAENAWWKFRERLTANRRYLVASRQFLVQKDAFQPRKELNPDDVKLLAHLLDADVIVTGFNEHRQFTLNVYLAQNGALFWSKKMNFHPSLKASDQLELVSDKLSQELLSEVPYQAFTIVDPLIGKAVYEEGAKKFAVVDVGNSDDVVVGTNVQWVQVMLPDKESKDPELGDSKIAVIGEGKVVKVRRGVVIAELLRAKSPEAIGEKTLVRIPSEAAKIAANNPGPDVSHERLAPEMVPTIINPVAPESSGARKNTLIFGSILSILGIIALAL